MNEQEIGFEQAMEQLEMIVMKLETGDLPLEQAIELFQEGIRLSRICSSKLESVERKIEILLEEEGQLIKKPFQSAEEKGDLL
jgi:exodeoxyribonuclease VII small subunit